MSGTNKNKWIIALIIVLLVCNAVTIALFWTRHRPGHPPSGRDAAAYIIRELQMDKSQQDKYEALIKEHRAASGRLREDIKSAKDNLYSLLQLQEKDSAAVTTATEKVKEQLGKLEMVTFEHFKKVRAICDPAQQKKFDAIIKNVLEMMKPGPRGPGHPPGEE